MEVSLPGVDAHDVMAPLKRTIPEKFKNIAPNKSAVLILLYPSETGIKVLTILRPEYNGAHSAQVGFPGGKYEENDETLEKTAIREANEEVGIKPTQYEILGALTPIYIPVSNFTVQPFLAIADSSIVFVPDTREVSKLVEIDISLFMQPSTLKRKSVYIALVEREVITPYFNIDDLTIWGATAMMLNELRELLKRTAITFS